MAFQSILFFLLVAGYSYSASVPTRIFGGEDTTIDHYTSLAQVEYLNLQTGIWSQTCAATILTSRSILSAASCFSGYVYSPFMRRIRAGTSYRNTGGQVVRVARERVHPNYENGGIDADLAVVELMESLLYSPVVQQVIIIAQDAEIPDNSAVVAAGWGFIDDSAAVSEQLRDVTLFTINNQQCRDQYAAVDKVVTENQICTGIPEEGGKAACQGDDGGPIYYQNIQVGIVSWGNGCGNPSYHGVNTKVSAYSDWIVKNAKF